MRSIAGILGGEAPKPPALVHGFLPAETLILVSAEPYTGKSIFCLDLALALATEQPVLGRYAPNGQKSVLFCGQDSPDWDYAEQVRKLARGRGLGQQAAEIMPLDLWFNGGWDLLNPAFLHTLEEWQHEHPVDVVIIDTLAAFHSADENLAREMGVVMTILKRLRDRFRWTIILTHHVSKPVAGDERSLNYRARGSSVISGSIDVHLSLARRKDMVQIRMPKGRGATPIDKSLGFTIGEDEDEQGVESVRLLVPPQQDSIPSLILSRLQLSSPASRGELVAFVKSRQPEIRATAVDNALALMKRTERVSNPQRGTWAWTSTQAA
jgi:hypothetical protein